MSVLMRAGLAARRQKSGVAPNIFISWSGGNGGRAPELLRRLVEDGLAGTRSFTFLIDTGLAGRLFAVDGDLPVTFSPKTVAKLRTPSAVLFSDDEIRRNRRTVRVTRTATIRDIRHSFEAQPTRYVFVTAGVGDADHGQPQFFRPTTWEQLSGRFAEDTTFLIVEVRVLPCAKRRGAKAAFVSPQVSRLKTVRLRC